MRARVANNFLTLYKLDNSLINCPIDGGHINSNDGYENIAYYIDHFNSSKNFPVHLKVIIAIGVWQKAGVLKWYKPYFHDLTSMQK